MNDAEQRFDDALTQLPRSVRPRRDLWPEIEAQINPQRADGSGYWALAAGWILTAVGIGLLGWRLSVETIEPTFQWPAEAPQIQLALEATRGELRNDLDRAVAMLSDEDQAALTAELNGLQAAREDVLAALQQTPENAFLQKLAVTTAQRELLVMQQVTQLGDRISQRT